MLVFHVGQQHTAGGRYTLGVQQGAAMQGGREGIWPEKIKWFMSSLANEGYNTGCVKRSENGLICVRFYMR